MVQRAAAGRPGTRWCCQPLFVVFQQQAPRVVVGGDEFQHRLTGVVHKRLALKRASEEIERFAGLPQTAFGKSALMQGEAADQMFSQGAGSSHAKLCAAGT